MLVPRPGVSRRLAPFLVLPCGPPAAPVGLSAGRGGKRAPPGLLSEMERCGRRPSAALSPAGNGLSLAVDKGLFRAFKKPSAIQLSLSEAPGRNVRSQLGSRRRWPVRPGSPAGVRTGRHGTRDAPDGAVSCTWRATAATTRDLEFAVQTQ